MKKKILSLILCLIIVFSFSACTASVGASGEGDNDYVISTKGEPLPYYSLTFDALGGDDVMPIGGFFGPYIPHTPIINLNEWPDYYSDDIFSKIVDCGVNIIVHSNTSTDYATNRLLEMCDKYDLGAFASIDYVTDYVGTWSKSEAKEYGSDFDYDYFSNRIMELNEHKSFCGIHTRDEPFTFIMDSLKEVYEAFATLGLKGKVANSNMIGWTESSNVYTGWDTVIKGDEYVEMYMNATHSPVCSSTCYIFNGEKTTAKNYQAMFERLAVQKRICDKYGCASWRMMQAGGQWNDSGAWMASVDPFPNEGEMIFDINVSLAYGCKGIQFFTLIEPEWYARAENYTYDYDRCGLIAANGEKTRWWYYAQKAIKQIKAIDHVLMKSSLQGIVLSGDEANEYVNPNGDNADVVTTFRQLKGVSGDAMIGCFDYQGGTALYVVNFSRTKKQNISLSFDNKYGYEVIQRATVANVIGKDLNLTLEAGEGALVVLK